MPKKIKWKNIYNKEKAWKIARKQERQTKYDLVWKTLEAKPENQPAK